MSYERARSNGSNDKDQSPDKRWYERVAEENWEAIYSTLTGICYNPDTVSDPSDDYKCSIMMRTCNDDDSHGPFRCTGPLEPCNMPKLRQISIISRESSEGSTSTTEHPQTIWESFVENSGFCGAKKAPRRRSEEPPSFSVKLQTLLEHASLENVEVEMECDDDLAWLDEATDDGHRSETSEKQNPSNRRKYFADKTLVGQSDHSLEMVDTICEDWDESMMEEVSLSSSFSSDSEQGTIDGLQTSFSFFTNDLPQKLSKEVFGARQELVR